MIIKALFLNARDGDFVFCGQVMLISMLPDEEWVFIRIQINIVELIRKIEWKIYIKSF